jgi:hypothetical protein
MKVDSLEDIIELMQRIDMMENGITLMIGNNFKSFSKECFVNSLES